MSRPIRNRPSTWSPWLRRVMDEYSGAAQAWFLAAEEVSLGYATELAEYAADHPRPTLKGFLIGMAGQS